MIVIASSSASVWICLSSAAVVWFYCHRSLLSTQTGIRPKPRRGTLMRLQKDFMFTKYEMLTWNYFHQFSKEHSFEACYLAQRSLLFFLSIATCDSAAAELLSMSRMKLDCKRMWPLPRALNCPPQDKVLVLCVNVSTPSKPQRNRTAA